MNKNSEGLAFNKSRISAVFLKLKNSRIYRVVYQTVAIGILEVILLHRERITFRV